jgi:hypothetical protein
MAPEKAAQEPERENVSPGNDAPASPVSAPRGKRGWWKSLVWPLVCLFQLGLIAGALHFGSRLAELNAPPPEPMEPAEPSPIVVDWKKECQEPEKVRAARGELDDVDRLLRASRYELALILCRSFSERAVANLRDAFQYRLGL